MYPRDPRVNLQYVSQNSPNFALPVYLLKKSQLQKNSIAENFNAKSKNMLAISPLQTVKLRKSTISNKIVIESKVPNLTEEQIKSYSPKYAKVISSVENDSNKHLVYSRLVNSRKYLIGRISEITRVQTGIWISEKSGQTFYDSFLYTRLGPLPIDE